MTQEQKDLLLKDLCARLPYKVKVQIKNLSKIYKNCTLEEIDCSDEEMSVAVKHENGELCGYDFDLAKPYLFPLSSMTEEQMHDFFCRFVVNEIDYIDFKHYYVEQNRWNKIFTTISDCFEVVTWFNKNHFDAYGLIPMGLAIDATGLNIY